MTKVMTEQMMLVWIRSDANDISTERCRSSAVLKQLAGDEQPLLVQRNSFLALDLKRPRRGVSTHGNDKEDDDDDDRNHNNDNNYNNDNDSSNHQDNAEFDDDNNVDCDADRW